MLLAVLVLLAVAFAGVRWFTERDEAAVAPSVADASPGVTNTQTKEPGSVVVPDVAGDTVAEAEVTMRAAGLVLAFEAETPEDGAKVKSQTPAAGTVAAPGAQVTVKCSTPKKAGSGSEAKLVVCIDPGHQKRSNMNPEPVGPGAKEDKPKVTGGTTGIKTRLPEHELTLQIAMNLKQRLEDAGVKVVMTRTTNDVDLSNSERAAIANKAKADLFVRIHADGSPDQKKSGASTLYPKSNKWTKGFAESSKTAAEAVQRQLVATTSAVDLGVVARGDLSGFNHSKVPAILVEAGFMSNPIEDRLLSSPHYQDKVAEGIAEGVLAYLGSAAQ